MNAGIKGADSYFWKPRASRFARLPVQIRENPRHMLWIFLLKIKCDLRQLKNYIKAITIKRKKEFYKF